MATFLDIGLLEFFLPAFYALFIWSVLFALINMSKLLGDNKYLAYIFATGITFIVMFSGDVKELIDFVTPWYAFLVIFLFLLFMIFAFMGMNEQYRFESVGGNVTIFVVALVILLIGINNVFGNVFFPNDEDPSESLTLRTLFHPRLLGAFVILVIVSLVIRQLDYHTKSEGKK